MFNAVKEKIKKENLIYRYFILAFSLFLSAITFNLFLKPTQIVTGGANGVAIILNYLFKFNTSTVITGIYIIVIILSLVFLGKKNTASLLVATVLYPVFVSITSNITNYIHFEYSDTILICLIVGLLTGITNGLILREGFSNGGLIVISQIFYKYFKISMSKVNFIVNLIIVLIGGFYLGMTNIMYAIIVLYINTIMLDRVLLGTSKSKSFYIITNKVNEITEFIVNELNHGVTLFRVKGSIFEKREEAVMVCLPTKEYFILTRTIKLIDKDAFFIATDSYQNKGGM